MISLLVSTEYIYSQATISTVTDSRLVTKGHQNGTPGIKRKHLPKSWSYWLYIYWIDGHVYNIALALEIAILLSGLAAMGVLCCAIIIGTAIYVRYKARHLVRDPELQVIALLKLLALRLTWASIKLEILMFTKKNYNHAWSNDHSRYS